MSVLTRKILNKLSRIESVQKELLEDWRQLEDFLLEISSPNLRQQIRQGRKAYRNSKAKPYQQIRKRLGLA